MYYFSKEEELRVGGVVGDKRGETPEGQDEEKEFIPVGDRHDGFGSQKPRPIRSAGLSPRLSVAGHLWYLHIIEVPARFAMQSVPNCGVDTLAPTARRLSMMLS